MFNNERLLINRDFVGIHPELPVSELCTLLDSGKVVLISQSNTHYLFTNIDLYLFKPVHSSIGSFLLENSHLASLAYPYEEQQQFDAWITKLPIHTQRPIIFYNSDHQPVGYCTLVQMLQNAWQAQQQMTAYFSTLAETVSDAVTVVDQNGTVVSWNAVAEEMYGISKENIIGRTIGEHFDPEALVVLKILDEGRLLRNTYHRPRPDTHVLVNASPILDATCKIIGGIATEQDITHLVKLNDELVTAHSSLLTSKKTDKDPFSIIDGRGEAIGKVIRIAKKIAVADSPVLFIGEPGAGKEQIAEVIHQASARAGQPFLSLNCGAIPVGLAESELFGFQGGAFSGNDYGQAGKLEAANGGTIYLNEIERLSLDVQDKLYQFMKRHSLIRSGGSEEIPVRTRIFAATTQDLEALVRANLFRVDLYYALNAVSIKLPALRDRKEDLTTMIQMYLRQFSVQYQKPIPNLPPEVLLAFTNYHWPGNITELRVTIERCVILSENDQILLEHLPEYVQETQPQLNLTATEGYAAEANTYTAGAQDRRLRPKISIDEEILLIKEALEQCSGNKSNAAKLLGISRGTLYNKIREYHME